ncbi:PucR family transcriptional regulator [Nonomuraea angiospora]|uniref:PucR family transcriptional regulator n=1 Tax=Nonomuraea angiospora TaxID=46172 RepID=UPI003416033C
MPPTLRTVVRRMRLRPVAGIPGHGARGVLDAAVRWVAVSELADPTPYLEGGELLLTTGMRMEGDQSQYVARLVARGVAGLGFGVGVSHEEVPPALVTAAEEAGLPLFEVPRETPFIAIGKGVSELLAAEQYDEISRAFAAQGRLTRAALRPEGMHAVIDRLAKEVGGWAALLDEAGEVRHATRGANTDAVVSELSRLRTAARPSEPRPSESRPSESRPSASRPVEHRLLEPRLFEPGRQPEPGGPTGRRPAEERGAGRGGEHGGSGERDGGGVHGGGRGGVRGGGGALPASLALSGPGEHIVVQPLGGGARPRGFFAVGAGQPFSPVTHTVINAAGSLLTLALEQGRTQLEAARRARSAVLELLLSGAGEQARAVLGPLGGRLPEEPLAVLAADADALEALEPLAFAALFTHGDAALGERPPAIALVPETVAEKVALEAEAPVGVSLPCGYAPEGLNGALDQARRALAAAPGSGGGPGKGGGRVVKFGELAGQGLLGLLDRAAAQAFAAALLAPLTAYGSRADLVESLRAYLDSNGHWDAAAQRLGVHRHTLRYRMKRVTELLGRDLDDPGVRAELWLALEATRR